MGASDKRTAGERAKHQGFLSNDRNKQKLILLLIEEVKKSGLYRACKDGRAQ